MVMLNLFAALILTQTVQPIQLKVEGVDRTGILVMPSKTTDGAAPLVFGFHGHGGNARQAQRSFGIEKAWPEAVVIYLQGLPTVGQKTDPEGKKNGWQSTKGMNGDRDLKFVDEALKWVKTQTKIDEKRIYTMGHSNGGGFSYLLWSSRPDLFAAIGVSAGGFRGAEGAKPTPVIHIAGEADPLVTYRGQEFNVGRVRQLNECVTDGVPWGGVEGALEWKSPGGNSVVLISHPGKHEYAKFSTAAFVKFFQEHSKK